MKLIEALKKEKELKEKAQDLRAKVATYSADVNIEEPMYPDQAGQIRSWMQAHADLMKELLKLRMSIFKTNLATSFTVTLGGIEVTKTIAEWNYRRQELAKLEYQMWSGLTDKGLKEGQYKTTTGELKEVKIRRYYDPKLRDTFMELFKYEPKQIDGKLEVANAVTDLIE